MSNGDRDPTIPAEVTDRLVDQLRSRGATVIERPHPGGHAPDLGLLPRLDVD